RGGFDGVDGVRRRRGVDGAGDVADEGALRCELERGLVAVRVNRVSTKASANHEAASGRHIAAMMEALPFRELGRLPERGDKRLLFGGEVYLAGVHVEQRCVHGSAIRF